jgi:hypothetical protein
MFEEPSGISKTVDWEREFPESRTKMSGAQLGNGGFAPRPVSNCALQIFEFSRPLSTRRFWSRARRNSCAMFVSIDTETVGMYKVYL